MNYALWGTSAFTARMLESLVEHAVPPALLVANPDRPAGRDKRRTPGAAAQAAHSHRIPALQPERLDEAFYQELKRAGLALSVVAAYARILSRRFLAVPRFGTVGVHPSLLPRHRGPTPIQTAILSGDETTGVSIYRLDEAIDRGPVIAERRCPVGNHTAETLGAALAALGARLLAELLPSLTNETVPGTPQDETKATYTRKFTAADGFVNPSAEDALAIERNIRALNPEPGVWTYGKFLPATLPGLTPETRVKLLATKREGTHVFLTLIHVEGKRPFQPPRPIPLGGSGTLTKP